jgi:pimeloyl-ACP methyl ester carboxylesterase
MMKMPAVLLTALAATLGAAPARDSFAKLDGHRIFYQSYGSGKKAVVFLSGWGCDTTLWRNQVAPLANYGRLLVVDLPGHGRSDKPQIRYSLDHFVNSVAAVLDHARVQKAVVVGHSMGGMVAYEFARLKPDRTIALMWVDGAFGIPIETEKQIAMFRARAKEFRAPDYKDKLIPFVDSLFIPATPAAVREEVRQSILATPQHVLAGAQEEFASYPHMFEHEVLNIPAFAVFSDYWKPERFIDAFKKYLPRLEYVLVTGVGHYPMLEKPAETSAQIAKFLERLHSHLR